MKKLNSILLIDDDETTNILNEMLLMEMDAARQILQTRNGKEGIILIRDLINRNESLPDLILLDINMPVMDGFGFLDAYRKLKFPGKSSIIIVMLTTSLNPRDIDRVKDAGITEYINKPLSEENLDAIFEKHC